ncbi:hypothetical protein SFRURICE_012059 [Spodoptera frugiperda]|nr:hypothetical protein SFRURICE_012059 [Spodoptera frugiperda]
MSGNVSEYDNIPTIRIKKKTQRVDVITGFAFNIIRDTLREAWDCGDTERINVPYVTRVSKTELYNFFPQNPGLVFAKQTDWPYLIR